MQLLSGILLGIREIEASKGVVDGIGRHHVLCGSCRLKNVALIASGAVQAGASVIRCSSREKKDAKQCKSGSMGI